MEGTTPRAGAPGGVGRGLPPDWNPARDVVVVLGAGARPVVEAFLRQGHARLIAYRAGAEPEALPAGAVAAGSPMELMTAMHEYVGDLPRHAAVNRVPGANVDDATHRDVAQMVQKTLGSLALFRNTIDQKGKEWVLNAVRNLPQLASSPSVAHLDDAFAGRPCAIVSPGPSLAKNIAELAALQGRAVIVSSTHALLPLQKAGIRPDLVLAADPGEHVRRHFHGVDLERIGALLIGAANEPGQLAFAVRHLVAFGSNSTTDQWIFDCFGERGDLHTGGSVACSALSLALRMGCDRVLFVGQDLSFPDGRYYVESAHDGASEIEVAADGESFVLARHNGEAVRPGEDPIGRNTPERALEVRGYHGGTVRTSASLAHFLNWFEVVARSTPDVELLNCTEGGAYIEGMRHVPLARAIEEWDTEPFDVQGVLDGRLGAVDVAFRQRATLARLDEMIAGLDRCAQLAERCDKLARRAGKDQGALDRLGPEEKRLSAALGPVVFVSILAQERIRAATKKGAEAKTLADNLAAARELFSVVLGASRLLRGPLADSRERLARRMNPS